jgi:outer membrane protein TolC
LLDVLNAEAEVFTASQSYENAKTSLTLAKFRLLNSEGRLLSFFGASV